MWTGRKRSISGGGPREVSRGQVLEEPRHRLEGMVFKVGDSRGRVLLWHDPSGSW